MPRRSRAWLVSWVALAALLATSPSCDVSRPRKVPPSATPAGVQPVASSVPVTLRALDAPGTPAPPRATREVSASELCLSAGRIGIEPSAHPLRVDAGGMRAIVLGDSSPLAELELTYRGPSTQSTPLANGELRRQIGLKLRAQDTCNVVYVMWHVEPAPGIAVSVKHNQGESRHADCTDQGYINVQPKRSAPVRPIVAGERRVLRAAIEQNVLRVWVDGALVWTGPLPPEAFGFDGPAGIRSDNGIFDFELRVPGARNMQAWKALAGNPQCWGRMADR